MATRGEPGSRRHNAGEPAAGRGSVAGEDDSTEALFDRAESVDRFAPPPEVFGPPSPEVGHSVKAAAAPEESVYAPSSPPRPRAPGSVRRRGRRGKPVRRVKRTIRHVDPFSVFRVSLMFYGCFLLIWLVVVAILYWILDAAGLFELIENVGDAVAAEGTWNVGLGLVEKWAFFIGVVVAVVMSLVNLFLAFLYNVVADIVGGIEITFVEKDL